MKKNIIILGGGFGGLRVARDLANMPEVVRQYDILLLDRQTHHLYTPLLYEVASAFLQDGNSKEAFCVRQGVCTEFSFLQHASCHDRVRFLRGDVTAIDVKKQHVVFGKEQLPYAYLVVALGATTEDFGIPGIREHGYCFKTMDDALAIHRRITEFLLRKRTGKEKRVTVVIGGGGPTGVELAAEISSFCRRASQKYGVSLNDFHVTLIEATSRLLGPLNPRVSAWAKERLLHVDVELWLDTCVKKVMRGEIVVAPRPLREGEHSESLVCDFRGKQEQTIEADIFIWSGGIRAPDVLKQSDLLLDAKGRVDVHDTLLAKGTINVFALGDCAALLDPKTNRVVPALGQAAIAEARIVAENIRRAIAGRHLHSYPYPPFAHLIPAGGKYAFGEFGSFHVRGFLMWLLRRFADLRYFFSILPLWYALKVWFDGWRVYTRND